MAKTYQLPLKDYEYPSAGWEFYDNRWWKWYGGYTGDWHTQWIIYNANQEAAAFEWWSWTDMDAWTPTSATSEKRGITPPP